MSPIRLFARIAAVVSIVAMSACSSSHDSKGSGSSGGGGGGGCPSTPKAPADAAPLLGAACDPLVPTQCGYPFPSNVYLVDDANTVTKKHVAIPKDAMPGNKVNAHLDPALVSDSDGFSPGQNILTHLPGATVTGLPTQDTLDLSVTTQSPTILMEADTGALVPHFSEIDMALSDHDEDRAFIIRPVARLKDATRYIVAIRHVVDKNGKELAPTPVFRALRDGTDSCDPSVALRKSLYSDIFGKLDKAGISKKDLQLAWDYSTASRENNTRWFLHMRDDALAKVGNDGPTFILFPPAPAGPCATTADCGTGSLCDSGSCQPDPAGPSCNNLTVSPGNSEETQNLSPAEIGSHHCSQDSPNPHIWRRIFGLMTVPIYTTGPNPGSGLNFGPDGLPAQNGTAEYEFEVNIPVSATVNKGTPLQNGHGLLGAKTEGDDGYLAEIDDQGDFVSVAVDLIGMSSDDNSTVLNALASDLKGFKDAVGRQHQGILNELLSMRMMNGLAKDPATFFNGNPTIDPTNHYYRGDSQGGIFGTTYMAVSTDVTRGVLGEPGLPYSLLLNRSHDFGPFFAILALNYDSRAIQLLLGVVQMNWDRTEPNGYVPYIADNTLPNTPPHRVLIHAAIGDYQVTPLGAEIIARTVGAKSLKPVNREIYGVEDADGPIDGSAIVEWDFGLLPAPKTDNPPVDLCPDPTPPNCQDPHDELRIQPESIDQEIQFFKTGMVVNTCGTGPCVGKFL